MPDRPIRVLHLSTDAALVAGAERLLLDLGRLTDPATAMLHFAFLRGGPVVQQLADQGSPTTSLGFDGPRRIGGTILRFERLIATVRPDIVHTHLFHGGVFGYFGAAPWRALGGIKLVHSRHYDDYNALFSSSLRYGLDRWVTRRFDRVLAVSDAVARQLVEVEGVARERVTVTRNGVDVDQLATLDMQRGRRALEEAGVPAGSDRKIVLCAATFREQKGHCYLAQAWVDVVRRVEGAELVLLGQGHLLEEIRCLVEELGIGSRVHFLGHRTNALEIMGGMDLYVQPSVEEGFGLALVEAMAMGKATLASRVGGMCHTVVDGETGRHVEPRDTRALADGIVQMLGDDDERLQMGRRGAARARAHYSIQRMIQDIQTVYDAVLGERPRM